MKVVAAEHIFGGERIIFYFIADGRVDFRDLVKTSGKGISDANRDAADRFAR